MVGRAGFLCKLVKGDKPFVRRRWEAKCSGGSAHCAMVTAMNKRHGLVKE